MPPVRLHPWPDLGDHASIVRRTVFLWLCTLSLGVMTGCAQLAPSPIRTGDHAHWIGRLALQIDEQEALSFSASFELNGDPSQGELVLFSPLGNVLAHLQWAPGRAALVSGSETRTSDSLDALLQQSTGTQLPVAALFDWLDGTASTADGWQADLSLLDQGRLTAVRHSPVPRATLRIALDR